MKAAALIVAAGAGARAGGGLPKQYRPLAGKPVLRWSVDALSGADIAEIVVAIRPEHEQLCLSALEGASAVRVVHGGATRTASVRAALQAATEADFILVHDAARPGLSADIALALLGELERGVVAVAPALAGADALVRADSDGFVLAEVDRSGLMRVQTPQAFRAEVLRDAYAALPAGSDLADDLAVARLAGHKAKLIKGDPRLMKLTYPEDAVVLEALMNSGRIVCVGNGVDAHRFGPGKYVTLCGVRIPHDKGLVGHSDADAGWHALVDAILGALGEGDIGAHFPPSDPQWKGADSERFLRRARQLAETVEARILHVDVTLVCERPKVGPHREAMRARTAAVLGLPINRVSIKATTTERMGFTGREEGLAAQATATVERRG
jgi:2-C-methyl-D-erythritol 4-phosphate cytidylyltransferase/2-C-methyl-D-erythritol 2,4-cyclodiphosphate synthase